MKKGLLLIIFIFGLVIFCVPNVQAATGSSYSSDGFVVNIGTTDFHSMSINLNNKLLKERVLLTKKKKVHKKPAKKKFIDTGDDDSKEGMLIAKKKVDKKPKKKK